MKEQNKQAEDIRQRAAKIRLLLLDVDGVLTDGRLYYGDSGEQFKVFNTLDGHGIKMLQRAGIPVGIITGRKSAMLETRARELGIDHLVQGREDKLVALQELLSTEQGSLTQSLETIAYVGDDLPDLQVMDRIGLACSVPGGHADVRARSHYVTAATGGAGAVREVCDLLLRAQDKYPELGPTHRNGGSS